VALALRMCTQLAALALIACASAATTGQRDRPSQPEAVPDVRGPDSTRLNWRPSWPGTQIAVVSGTLSGDGPFVFRFRMPNGYWICPHTHPVDARIRVVSGMFHVGMGPILDTARVRTIMTGDTVVLVAGTAHFEGAHGDTDIEVRGVGTWGIRFLDPRHDPTQAAGGCMP
jgi:quercetin dioxygenase-like cupin family protein